MGIGRRPLALLRRLTPENNGESGVGHIKVKGWLRCLHEPPPAGSYLESWLCYLFSPQVPHWPGDHQEELWLPSNLWSIFSVPSSSVHMKSFHVQKPNSLPGF